MDKKDWTPQVEDSVFICGKITNKHPQKNTYEVTFRFAGGGTERRLYDAADLFPVPDPAAPTVEEVLEAGAAVYADMIDTVMMDCPAAYFDEDIARCAGCPCPVDTMCEEDGGEECWKKVLPALILNCARQLAAEREGTDE